MSKSFYRPHIAYGPYPFHMMQTEYPQPNAYMPNAYMPYPPMGMEYPPEAVDEDAEMEYWQNMYPEQVKTVQQYVKDYCDKLDYDGSMMYDEYPDRVALYRISKNIYQMMRDNEDFMQDMESEREQPQENRNREEMDNSMEEDTLMRNMQIPFGSGRPGHPERPWNPERPHQDNWFKNLIDVLLFQEMHKRRCNHKHCRRRWY